MTNIQRTLTKLGQCYNVLNNKVIFPPERVSIYGKYQRGLHKLSRRLSISLVGKVGYSYMKFQPGPWEGRVATDQNISHTWAFTSQDTRRLLF